VKVEDINKAIEAMNNGDRKKAYSIAKRFNKNPKFQSETSLQIEALAEFDNKNFTRAIFLFEKAIIKANENGVAAIVKAEIFCNLGAAKAANGEFDSATAFLSEAIDMVPHRQSIRFRFKLAVVQSKASHFEEAILGFKAILPYGKYKIRAIKRLIELGQELSDKEMVTFYISQLLARTNELSEEDIQFLVAQANQSRTLDLIKLYDYLKSRNKTNELIEIVKAGSLQSTGKLKECLQCIEEIDKEKLTALNLIFLYSIKGKALDSKKNFNDAFLFFEKMNHLKSEELKDLAIYTSELKNRFTTQMQRPTLDIETPLNISFLVGFPRSGTTLLENIIDTQSNIKALEEKPMMWKTELEAKRLGMKSLGDVARLSHDSLSHLREYYLTLLKAYCRTDDLTQYDAIIDKQPMNIILLPLIKAIFPEAKIILALRHPLDCILSCYFQNFSQNKEMVYFNDWQNCFIRYKEVFDLYQYYEEHLNINCFKVKYEDVLNNFDIEIEKLFNFIDVPYDNELAKDFHNFASKKLITSASKEQVKKGLYRSSKQRWKNYQKFIEPHIDIVNKHIKHLGYGLD
jgi:Tfp pilus assembly protein PilF